ncbi:phage tail tube protein [Entomobacter blattae]|uniref:Phage tail tube protein n=1 Tax=Entomobacter blattae TaxID=2762277 RepID=A0A7H1NUI2_9PROT|nr:phage tail tube protein [Entomobacter blattae]QNT79442.1 Phage tail tube protein [Entomobacter blattae]
MASYVNQGPLAGLATLTINGEDWSVVSDLSYMPSGLVNETLKGQTRVEGYSAMPGEGYVSATLRDRNDRKLSDYKGASGLTVIARLANGKIVTCNNGWVTDFEELKTQEGTFSIKFVSDDVSEDVVGAA